MTSEIVQFAAVLVAAAVAFVTWLAVIYLPRRTMERKGRKEDEARGETSPSGSDRTR